MARKISYSKYLRAKNFIGFNRGIDISNALANTMKNSVRRATVQNASDLVSGSLVGGVAGAFGSVGKSIFVNLKQIDKRLDSKILDDGRVKYVMLEILKDAQEITPVDKKFIGKNKNVRIGKNFQFSLPVSPSLEKREEGFFQGDDKNIILLNSKYSIERQREISKRIIGNRRLESHLWFEPDKESGFGHINFYRTRKKRKDGGYDTLTYNERNIRLATAFSDNKWHYGEEELKRSGNYDDNNHIISFDPTRLGAKYNYAALQHDRLDFKHKGKGQALFLYKAYVKHRRDLIATLDEVTQERLANLLSKREPQRRFNPATDIPVANRNIAKRNIAKSMQSMKRALGEMAKFN